MEKILVLDDEQDVVDVALAMIDARHEVCGTTDPDRALELIRVGGIWLLITDIRMPGQSGFAVIEKAKALSPRLAVMVLSAHYDRSSDPSQAVFLHHADLALAKPLNALELNRAIESLQDAGAPRA